MSTTTRAVIVAGQQFALSRQELERIAQTLDPEPIFSHYVVIGGRRFPPKQILGAMTGLDRADFTTHQARRTLVRLGFVAGRRMAPGEPQPAHQGLSGPDDDSRQLVDQLRPLVGQWVAVQHDDVLHSAETLGGLVDWLSRHGQKAESVFRVPWDEVSETGLAPL